MRFHETRNHGQIEKGNKMTITKTTFEWEGIEIEVSFDPQSYSDETLEIAHLQVRSINPLKAPLPITNTGYRSEFLGKGRVEEYGSVEAYVLAWLKHEARSKEWRQYVKESQQLSLF